MFYTTEESVINILTEAVENSTNEIIQTAWMSLVKKVILYNQTQRANPVRKEKELARTGWGECLAAFLNKPMLKILFILLYLSACEASHFNL